MILELGSTGLMKQSFVSFYRTQGVWNGGVETSENGWVGYSDHFKPIIASYKVSPFWRYRHHNQLHI